MSFDLYVWHEPMPITVDRALLVCQSLAAGDDTVVQPDPRNLALLDDLLVGFPDPDDPDDDEIDDLVWSVSPDVNEHRLILCVGWSRADDFSRAVFALAQKHGLTCFDPQRNEVHNPSMS
ncbi:hypothetical protein SM007_28635 [Streptomyces avermitilis]|uniref:Uncharacterized protein n=1 Tax=Streptomyces avermitilis TaxID=33903 RepID=A0A4D4MAS7_STRAX|nr:MULTISPECIES: hypothetical protein [Streptomyces]MYS95829.1 hypothetical protein [Streptomyces sp. SID5469]OOV24806.1 hypothetical protein SM007_28635 [Streptomyces avermitilis]BBJ47496.1 hypothetical protein SAVMC3_01250 [Streptomyces avermitilis]GDY68978.1 hypothetical protein SAV14893_083710 [Streptomyces avermitilis]GDY70639.1 hypothetical protein SAV31267_001240 [Streptomyces avermitilis]